jgi:hypothetical protein
MVSNASQTNVSGEKNWAAPRQGSGYVIVRATTAPDDTPDEWKHIRWSGDGQQVKSKPNERKVPLRTSKMYHVEAKLGERSDHVDIWILWAKVQILTKGPRPANSAPFDLGIRDQTQNLGAVTYESLTASLLDEATGETVTNVGAAGKVAPVATLQPSGVHEVVKAGWDFKREVWSHVFLDGRETAGTNKAWTPDNSKSNYLRLIPDTHDKIYDLDAPDLRWATRSFEVYHNFRQWIEWNSQRCSDLAPWHWRARWRLNRIPRKQITLNELGVGHIALPQRAFYRPP